MWDVKISPHAKKFLDSLNKEDIQRIVRKLKDIEANPFRFLEHYEGCYYKLRIGDFRALIDLQFERKIILIQVLDKRGRIYKR